MTETWLRDQKDAEVKIDGYKLYRSDRIRQKRRERGRDSGGVAIYLREDLETTSNVILKTSVAGVIEILAIHIKSLNLVVIVIYRQPDDVVGGNRSTNKEFKKALEEIRTALNELPSPSPDILLGGDFNLPHIRWPEAVPEKKATAETKRMLADLNELVSEYFMLQYITEPTHKDGNILDLCFCSNPRLVHSVQFEITNKSHHSIVKCRTTLNAAQPREESFRTPHQEDGPGSAFDSLNFYSEKADWTGLEAKLRAVDWNSEIGNEDDPEEMMKTFIKVCAETSADFIPKRKVTEQKKSSPIPRHRRILMRRRTKVHKKLNRPRPLTENQKKKLMDELIDIEKKLQESYSAEQTAEEHKAVNAIKTNSKYFYSYARRFSKIAVGIGPFIDAAGKVISCPVKMASMLVHQYSTVFSTPKEPLKSPQEIFDDHESQDLGRGLFDFEFTEKDLIEAISEISPSSAAGPDRFPAILLKQ